MAPLPTGTVTFLFTDLEGSTQLLQQLGEEYARVLGEHQVLLRAAFAAHDGAEVDTQGDAFFVAFPTAPAAAAAATDATRALAERAWPEGAALRVRIGLHTGTPQLVGDHYVGLDVHRAARIAAAGHGGQVLLSQTTRDLAVHALPKGATLRAVGAHRLKDLQEPEPLFQLVLPGLPADFPPLKTLDTYQHNLPLQATPLLGREEQVRAVGALLQRAEVRLVTLTGPGGIGKTRLAVQVAAELVDDFADGVWFVRLSRLVDPNLVIPTIAQTLGLQERGSQPIAALLREHVADKRLLLVLDNFEQVVGAAPEVTGLLAASAGLRVLVTSRLPLRLRGEKTYTVAPLPLAKPGDAQAPERLTQYAAVALFIERARDARSDFAVTVANAPAIAEVCVRLDGLPLAIELAAARVRVLPPEALLARLSAQLKLLTGGARDAEERQQTMGATIAWSEDLLTSEERVFFRRLAVFVGGCTLEAAEAVCGAPAGAVPLGLDLLEGLSTLVEQSLVQQREEGGEARFGMLHVIREYALEQLEASDGGKEAETLRRAHAAYYEALAERHWAAGRASLDVIDPDELAAARKRLWLEQDNLRAALAWLQAQAEGARRTGEAGRARAGRTATRRDVEAPGVQGLRLAGALLWVWAKRGHLSEGRARLGAFLALDAAAVGAAGAQAEPGGPGASTAAQRSSRRARAAGHIGEVFVRARALYAAGVLAYWQGESAQAVPLLERSLALFQALGDRLSAGYALNNLGIALQDQGDLARARACYEASMEVGRALGMRDRNNLIGMPLSNLATLTLAAGDLDQAATYSDEALAVSRQVYDYTSAAYSRVVQALTAWRRGQVSQAAALAHEALVLHHAARDERHYGDGLEVCAIMCASQGRAEQAARLLGTAAACRERIGMLRPMGVPTAADIEAGVATARVALGEEAWETAFAAGRALSMEAAIAEALGEVAS